jgi:hypothetical protein
MSKETILVTSRRKVLLGAAGIGIAALFARRAASQGLQQPGPNPSILYQTSDGTVVRSRLTEAKTENVGVPLMEHTDDPNWVVTDRNGGTKTEQWTPFLAWDGTARKTRIASSLHHPGNPPDFERIISEFVQASLDGSDESRGPSLVFTDPQNTYYSCALTDIGSPFNAAPTFLVSFFTPVPGGGTLWRVVPGDAVDIGPRPRRHLLGSKRTTADFSMDWRRMARHAGRCSQSVCRTK